MGGRDGGREGLGSSPTEEEAEVILAIRDFVRVEKMRQKG